MADDSDDGFFFEIGVGPNEEASQQLDKFADAVVASQDRVTEAVRAVGDEAVKSINRLQGAMNLLPDVDKSVNATQAANAGASAIQSPVSVAAPDRTAVPDFGAELSAVADHLKKVEELNKSTSDRIAENWAKANRASVPSFGDVGGGVDVGGVDESPIGVRVGREPRAARSAVPDRIEIPDSGPRIDSAVDMWNQLEAVTDAGSKRVSKAASGGIQDAFDLEKQLQQARIELAQEVRDLTLQAMAEVEENGRPSDETISRYTQMAERVAAIAKVEGELEQAIAKRKKTEESVKAVNRAENKRDAETERRENSAVNVGRFAQTANLDTSEALKFIDQNDVTAKKAQEIMVALKALRDQGGETRDIFELMRTEFGLSAVEFGRFNKIVTDNKIKEAVDGINLAKFADEIKQDVDAALQLKESFDGTAGSAMELFRTIEALTAAGASNATTFDQVAKQFGVNEETFDRFKSSVENKRAAEQAEKDNATQQKRQSQVREENSGGNITQLASTLELDVAAARDFADQAGVTAKSAVELYKAIDQLRDAGADTSTTLAIVTRDLGVSEQAFNAFDAAVAKNNLKKASEEYSEASKKVLDLITKVSSYATTGVKGLAQIGLLSEENEESLLKSLVAIEGVYNAIQGGIGVIQSATSAWKTVTEAIELARSVKSLTVLLSGAEARASNATTLAMGRETVAVLAATAAHERYNDVRSGASPRGANSGQMVSDAADRYMDMNDAPKSRTRYDLDAEIELDRKGGTRKGKSGGKASATPARKGRFGRIGQAVSKGIGRVAPQGIGRAVAGGGRMIAGLGLDVLLTGLGLPGLGFGVGGGAAAGGAAAGGAAAAAGGGAAAAGGGAAATGGAAAAGGVAVGAAAVATTVAAAAAAFAAVGLVAVELSETFSGTATKVGSVTDSIATWEVGLIDSLGRLTGAFDLTGKQAAEDMQNRVAQRAELQLQAEEQKKEFGIVEQRKLDTAVTGIRDTERRDDADLTESKDDDQAVEQSILQDAVKKRLELEARILMLSREGKQNSVEYADAVARVETQTGRIDSAYKNIRSNIESMSRVQIDAANKTIKSLEDELKKPKDRAEALDRQRDAAAERFGKLGVIEQRKSVEAIRKARSGEELSKADLGRVDSLGTEEGNKFASDQYKKKAKAAGFDEIAMTIDTDRAKATKEIAQIEAKIQQQQNIVLKYETDEKKLVGDIVAKVREENKMREARLRRDFDNEIKKNAMERDQYVNNTMNARKNNPGG